MKFATHDLVVRYANAPAPALAGVSMEAAEGSLYAVVGPNGSGKSTLMKALMGLVTPQAGSALVGDRSAQEWDRRELARTVGAVAQSERVAFPLTVRELVAMGRYPHLGPLRMERDEDREAIDSALRRCDVSHLGHRDAGTLSGGEGQRVRIARALAQEPRALLLDEPTTSLDIAHEMAIFELLRASADQGMTVLVITHNLNVAARFADRMLLLSEGKVEAQGPPEEVLRADLLTRVYEWPLDVAPDPVGGALRVTPLRNS